MARREFERVAPEKVGVDSAHLHHLLDRLEESEAEMHGLMVMRHGKICAEGWWAPYAPGIRHGLQSHTKTYAATGIGIACTEGILRLDERVTDIFPEFRPEGKHPLLERLTVHDVLSMGCGMERMPRPTRHWIRDFLAIPVVHPPGERFMYNSVGSTLLAAIVRRRSGRGLHEYLNTRLFEKIGIDGDNLRWIRMPDGTELGGGGLYATTEDNLRLMKLYADGGAWEGERILSEDFVRRATTKQIETATEDMHLSDAKDNFSGYGYQIWMCRPEGVYRADGAMGQFTVVNPRLDMLVSVTETAVGAYRAQHTLDLIWAFFAEVEADHDRLPERAGAASLERRLRALSLQRPAFAPYSPRINDINRRQFRVTGGVLRVGIDTATWMGGMEPSEGIRSFMFTFREMECLMYFEQDGMSRELVIGLDGSWRLNTLRLKGTVETMASAAGEWIGENLFSVTVRWIETCFMKEFRFDFADPKAVRIEVREPKPELAGTDGRSDGEAIML